MKTKFLPILIFAALVALTGCKPKETAPSHTIQTVQTSLSGQMFIVTQGAESIKLGDVEILLIEKSQVTDFLQKRQSVIEPEVESRQQEFATAQENLQKAQAAYKSLITNENSYTVTNAGIKFEAMTAAESLAATSKAKLLENFPTIEDYLGNFSPIVFQKTLTDADGKFSFVYSQDKQLTIFASAQRISPSGTEKYYWLVDAPTNTESAQIFLSNNNLVFVDPDGYFKLKPKQAIQEP